MSRACSFACSTVTPAPTLPRAYEPSSSRGPAPERYSKFPVVTHGTYIPAGAGGSGSTSPSSAIFASALAMPGGCERVVRSPSALVAVLDGTMIARPQFPGETHEGEFVRQGD